METPEPPDLRTFEEALKFRHDLVREAGSRQRILNRVRHKLTRHKQNMFMRRWHFAAGLAAAVMLGLNLSMCVGSAWNWNSDPVVPIVQSETIEQLREILPELSEAELQRQACTLACAGPRRAGATRFPILNSTERAELWDMH